MALNRQVFMLGALCVLVVACQESSTAPAAQPFEDRVHAWVGQELEIRHLDAERSFWEDFRLVLRLAPSERVGDHLAFDRVPPSDNKAIQAWRISEREDRSVPFDERLEDDLRVRSAPTIEVVLSNGYVANRYLFQLIDGKFEGWWSGRGCLGPAGEGRAVLQLASAE